MLTKSYKKTIYSGMAELTDIEDFIEDEEPPMTQEEFTLLLEQALYLRWLRVLELFDVRGKLKN